MEKELEKTKRKTPLEMFKEIKELEVADSPLMTVEDCLPFMCEKVEQALIKAQEDKDIFVIYCSNNYHNYYMDYKGELTPFENATLFDDELEAHKFLREHSGNKYDNWCVVNVKNLDNSRKCWNK